MLTGEHTSIGANLDQTSSFPRRLPGRRESCYAESIYTDPCDPGDIFEPSKDGGFYGLGFPRGSMARLLPGSEGYVPDQEVAGLGILPPLPRARLLPGSEGATVDAASLFGLDGPPEVSKMGSLMATALGGGIAYLLFRNAVAERKQGWQVAGYVAGTILGLAAFGNLMVTLGLVTPPETGK